MLEPPLTFDIANPSGLVSPTPVIGSGVAYGGELHGQGEARRGSCDFHGVIGSDLPPKPPASRRFSMDSSARAAQVQLLKCA